MEAFMAGFTIAFVSTLIGFAFGFAVCKMVVRHTVNRIDRHEPDNEMNSGRY